MIAFSRNSLKHPRCLKHVLLISAFMQGPAFDMSLSTHKGDKIDESGELVMVFVMLPELQISLIYPFKRRENFGGTLLNYMMHSIQSIAKQ